MANEHYQQYFDMSHQSPTVGGMDMDTLCHLAGQTPFYVYSSEVIERKIQILREALPESISLHYALKANPMPQLVRFLASLVDGLDVASLKELQVATSSGINAAAISFAGPGKSDAELCAAMALGATLNIESVNELNRVVSLRQVHNFNASVAIRINPDFSLKNSGMTMGGGSQQFGIDAEKIEALIKDWPDEKVKLRGFHLYWGSQNLNVKAIQEAHKQTFNTIDRLLSHCENHDIREINIGGGFGIPYFPNDNPLDLKPIGDNLAELLATYPQIAAKKIVIELGRFIVGEAGLYVTKIVDIKESRGSNFIVCDGGLHHHLALSGNFGQVLRKNYPVDHVKIASNLSSPSDEPSAYNAVGPLCTPLDILGQKLSLISPKVGDLLVVYQSGAYGYSASPHQFLSHPLPVELFI